MAVETVFVMFRPFLFAFSLLGVSFAWEASAAPSSSRSKAAIARVSDTLKADLADSSLTLGAPVFIRIIKQKSELQVFLQRKDGPYELFQTYPICAWSGELGPKLKEGDGQSPEGFYSVSPVQMNPSSSFHLSFNLGYPNAFDRAHGRTGSYLMVHGNCVSIGCYAMTDPVIEELWTLMVHAFDAGQTRVPVHIFPFEMTEDNLAANAGSKWSSFWNSLATVWAAFEQTGHPPDVRVVDKAYVLSK